jgi:transposase
VPKGDIEEAQIDSAYMKAHRYAYGKRGAIGTGRGGPTTKVHGLCDGRGVWHRLSLSAGNHHDAPYAPLLVKNKRIHCLLADRAYDSDAFLAMLNQANTVAVIPLKRNRKHQGLLDKEAYKRRHVIENGWLTLKDNCRLALRRNKLDITFYAFLALAAALSNGKKLVT